LTQVVEFLVARVQRPCLIVKKMNKKTQNIIIIVIVIALVLYFYKMATKPKGREMTGGCCNENYDNFDPNCRYEDPNCYCDEDICANSGARQKVTFNTY